MNLHATRWGLFTLALAGCVGDGSGGGSGPERDSDAERPADAASMTDLNPRDGGGGSETPITPDAAGGDRPDASPDVAPLDGLPSDALPLDARSPDVPDTDALPPVDGPSLADLPDFGDVVRPEPWADAAAPFPPELCDAPPALPVAPQLRLEAPTLADYGAAAAAYDATGRLAVVTRTGDLYRVEPDGTRTLWVARVAKTPRGMAFLSTGELVIADSGRGMLVKVYPGGEVRTLVPHLDAPMDLEVDPEDFLYVSEATRGAVRRIDPLTGRTRVLVDALAEAPGALAFSADYRTLYVGAARSGTIWALDRDAAGAFGPLRVFATLGGAAANPCDGRFPGERCAGGTCRQDAAGAVVCLPDGQCLPEDIGIPCGAAGFCLSDGLGGAVCSEDDFCQGRAPGELCVSGGIPGMCTASEPGQIEGLSCLPAPCGWGLPGSVCLDAFGAAGRCADNLQGRQYCQTGAVCRGRIEGAPCVDEGTGAAGTCARAGRAALYCVAENPCADESPGVRCVLPGLGGAAFCDLNQATGQTWCRPPGSVPCAGQFDGASCETAVGTPGVCFNTGLEALCFDPNPCAMPGQGCATADGVAGTCVDDGTGSLVCQAGACVGLADGAPCAGADGSLGRCDTGLCGPAAACDALPAGSSCLSPRTRGEGICWPGAGGNLLCHPLNPCAGAANGAECTVRQGAAGTCVVSGVGGDGGEPYCDIANSGAFARALETDACGHVYASDDAALGVWRISADGANTVLAASLPHTPITSLLWAPTPDGDPPVLHAIGHGGADVIAIPLGVPGRRVVMPRNDAVLPDSAPDEHARHCLELPDTPGAMTPALRASGYHDVAFDRLGHVIGFDGTALVQVDRAGNVQLFAPGVAWAEGMDWLPDGSLVVSSGQGLVRVAANGAQVAIAPDIYAYGVTVGPDGLVYAADNSTTIWRVNADTLAVEPYWVNDGSLALAPRTLNFDLDRSLMYIGTFGDKVYSMAIDRDLTPLAQPRVLATVTPGAAFMDGLAVDDCGNLYMPNYESAALYRIAPDGDVKLYHQWDLAQYGHGLEWGSGVGGWRTDALYLPQPYNSNTVLEMVIGTRGRPKR